MTQISEDRFIRASKENLLDIQRKIKTNNVMINQVFFPEINDTYSPTELNEYIIPLIKQISNMNLLPVFSHTDSRKMKWKFRILLIQKQIN